LKLLIIKLGALGDVVNTLPLAVNLKTRLQAEIHWLVEPLSHPLVAGHPFVDRAILFDKHHWRSSLADVRREIRGVRYDAALDLQRILKSGFFCLQARAARRIGFDRRRCKEMTWLLPFERIAPGDPGDHMLRQYLEFAGHFGLPRCEVRWEIPLDRSGPPLDLPQDYVVLNIGATKPANRWLAERFAALADTVFDEFHLPCVLTGGPEDRGRAELIRTAARRPPFDLVGRTALPDLIAVLRNSRLVVTGDTGPMHLAVALGRKVVALFGPADPRRTGPYRGHVIQKATACADAPCGLKNCAGRDCMKAITVADVVDEMAPLLG
jgi:ADP-heptose:LPS heptosyltransferase